MEKIKSEPMHHEPAAAVDEAIAVTVDPRALSCPKCLHPLRPPVFQCAAGHVVCAPCHGELPDKSKCSSCFIKTGYGYGYSRCFVPTRYTRCLAVERILRSLRVAGAPGSSSSSVLKMGPCGGGRDEDAWDQPHVVVHGAGVNNRRVVKVVVHHEDAVNAISVSHGRDDGGQEEQHSKPRGTVFGKRSERDEYLTSVKGRYGQFNGWSVIRALTFVSNRRTYGPYGTQEGMEFELPAAGGGKIVGFHGRSGGLIDAIGTYVTY